MLPKGVLEMGFKVPLRLVPALGSYPLTQSRFSQSGVPAQKLGCFGLPAQPSFLRLFFLD